MKDKTEMKSIPVNVGVYGVWSWKIENHAAYHNAILRGEMFPQQNGVKMLDMRGGKFEDINAFIESSYHNAEWLLTQLNDGAHIITIGTGEKWQIYDLTSQTAKDILEAISEAAKKFRAEDY